MYNNLLFIYIICTVYKDNAYSLNIVLYYDIQLVNHLLLFMFVWC